MANMIAKVTGRYGVTCTVEIPEEYVEAIKKAAQRGKGDRLSEEDLQKEITRITEKLAATIGALVCIPGSTQLSINLFEIALEDFIHSTKTQILEN